MADWSALVTLATTGAGWSTQPGTALSPGSAVLAGSANDLVAVLDRVPTGRLLLLGEQGSGKTILLVRLTLDLLERRRPGEAVPILLPLASWNPAKEGLYAWMERWLITGNAALSEPARAGSERASHPALS